MKVRVNIHGIFSVSSASLVEVQKFDETEEPMDTEQANDKDEQVHPNKFLFPVLVLAPHVLLKRPHCLYLKVQTHGFFITHLKNKMQTDQEEQQNQGDCQKEAEQKTSHENEEMEVRCLVSTWS